MLFAGRKWMWILAGFLVVVGLVLWWWKQPAEIVIDNSDDAIETESTEPVPTVTSEVIGQSVQGRDITAYHYGTGDKEILFVGGIHGGYEWNSALLAYNMMDYFAEEITNLPEGISVTIIPAANPDGLHVVTGKEGRFAAVDVAASYDDSEARFNANGVDLNRNFDCKWAPESSWRGQTVSAGTGAFSEPEAAALRDYIVGAEPEAVVFWHSKANAVYASECLDGVLSETITVMDTYATAAEYKAIESFDAYPVTGDAEGWLASIGIPAVTVELATHESIEWNKNLAGTEALLELFSAEVTK